MSPRRSPRFKKSPKPELPKKPRQPKRVENPAEHSVRQAKYQVELAAWEAAKKEHENLMQKRKAKQNAVSKIARESMGGKDSPAPSTPPATPPAAPSAQERPAPWHQLQADLVAQARHPVVLPHSFLEWCVPDEYRAGRTFCLDLPHCDESESRRATCSCGMITAQRLATQQAW